MFFKEYLENVHNRESSYFPNQQLKLYSLFKIQFFFGTSLRYCVNDCEDFVSYNENLNAMILSTHTYIKYIYTYITNNYKFLALIQIV